MSSSEYNEHHREYVKFSHAYSGHVFIGILVAFVASFIYGVLTVFLNWLIINFLGYVLFICLLVLLSEFLVVLFQRPLVIKAQRGSPGGILFAAYEVIVTPCCAYLLALLIFHDTRIAGVWALIFLVLLLLEAVMMKSWEPGMSQAEIRERWEATKKMLREEGEEKKIEEEDEKKED